MSRHGPSQPSTYEENKVASRTGFANGKRPRSIGPWSAAAPPPGRRPLSISKPHDGCGNWPIGAGPKPPPDYVKGPICQWQRDDRARSVPHGRLTAQFRGMGEGRPDRCNKGGHAPRPPTKDALAPQHGPKQSAPAFRRPTPLPTPTPERAASRVRPHPPDSFPQTKDRTGPRIIQRAMGLAENFPRGIPRPPTDRDMFLKDKAVDSNERITVMLPMNRPTGCLEPMREPRSSPSGH